VHVHIFMYVFYMCICMYVLHIHVHIFILHIHVHIFILHIHVHILIFVFYMCICMYTCTCIHVCILYVSMYMCICMYMAGGLTGTWWCLTLMSKDVRKFSFFFSFFQKKRRFDRHVVVPNPDVKGRTQILNLHLSNVPVDKGVKVCVCVCVCM